MTSFSTLLSVHLISIALSVGLLTLRFWLRYQKHPQAFARWTRIVPPVVDTLLLLSGIALMAKAHILPFSGQAPWLTTVASAAPDMPISHTKIRIGSSTTLMTAPLTIPTMAYAALP